MKFVFSTYFFFAFLLSWNLHAQEKWAGYIDGYYPISLDLVWEDYSCSGTIDYEECDLGFDIYGEKNDSTFLINEYCEGDVVGHILLKKYDDIWSGHWKAANGTLELPVSIEKEGFDFPKMDFIRAQYEQEIIYCYPYSPVVQVVKKIDLQSERIKTEYFFRYEKNWTRYKNMLGQLEGNGEQFSVIQKSNQQVYKSQDYCIPDVNPIWTDSIQRFFNNHLKSTEEKPLETCFTGENRWKNRSYGFVDIDVINEFLIIGSAQFVGDEVVGMPFCFDRKSEAFISLTDFIFKTNKSPEWTTSLDANQYLTCDVFGLSVKHYFNSGKKEEEKYYSFHSLSKVIKNKSIAKIQK